MKENALFLCVDLGTSFIKTGIYDTDGNCHCAAKVAVKDEKPAPGVVIQHGGELFASVTECLKKTVEQAGGDMADRIEAMSFTGQMAGFMGVDAEWNDVTTWSCFIDGRYVPYANLQMERFAEQFLLISGTNAPLMAPKIEWFQTEFPKESARIAKYMMISSYIIGRLGDLPIEEAVMDHSFLSWTGLGDIAKDNWSDTICGLIGTEKERLPRIVRSNEIVGTLCKKMADEIGLKAGIPLVSGAGDKVAGNVGAGILHPGDAIFEAGTYGAVSVMTGDFRPNIVNNYYDVIPAAIEGLYAHKYIPGSGMTLDWFVQTFLSGMTAKEAFAWLEEQVPKIPPGCDGVSAVGLLGGNAMPFNGMIRGRFSGYTWSHGVAHFYRALLESFACDLALTVDAIYEQYPEYPMTCLKIIGGGAKSPAWMQILADVTGRTFERLDREDIALWGAAILAGSAVGIFPDVAETAAAHVSVRERVRPDPSKYDFYRKQVKIYQEETGKHM